ncbi:hypothetical protein [Dactylosporangium sp. NPDC051484]|uniref:hypothetical protein n=1 Tax=Dactylosporangium sp. NPDC051484 TaxID=3154942 RepID=UPI00344F4D77
MYIYHGGNDGAVKKSVNDDPATYFRDFGASVRYDTGSAAGHAWVTSYGTVGCSATASPYLNDCGTDPQRDLLGKLFGGVASPQHRPARRDLRQVQPERVRGQRLRARSERGLVRLRVRPGGLRGRPDLYRRYASSAY